MAASSNSLRLGLFYSHSFTYSRFYEHSSLIVSVTDKYLEFLSQVNDSKKNSFFFGGTIDRILAESDPMGKGSTDLKNQKSYGNYSRAGKQD